MTELVKNDYFCVAPRPRQGPWNVAHGFSRGKENTNRKAPAGRGKMAHAHLLVPLVFLTKR